MLFDDDNQDRPPNSNRFFFSNAPQGRGRILSREGYAVFTSSFTVTWLLCIFFVVWLHLEMKVTNDIVSTISSSAVDLAALSLAVLTILHEFNKEDRWFKLGLFFVGFLFVIDCLTGFYMVVSWNHAYEMTQSVDVIVFGVLFIGLVFQSDWELVYTRYSARIPKIFRKSFYLLSKIKSLNLIRAYIPFIIPFAFIWVNKLSPIITFLLIFLGGIIALLCLMLVTSIELVRQRQSSNEQVTEDPIVTYSRKVAIEQLEASKNLQRLLETITVTLSEIQEERVAEARTAGELIPMVSEETIVSQLRLKGIVTRQQDIRSSLRLLEKQNRAFNKNGEYWLVPSKAQILSLAENIKKVYWFGTRLKKDSRNTQEWRNLQLNTLFDELGKSCCMPIAVVEEFIFPKSFSMLNDSQFFEKFEIQLPNSIIQSDIIYVNLEMRRNIEIQDWSQLSHDSVLISFRKYVEGSPERIEKDIEKSNTKFNNSYFKDSDFEKKGHERVILALQRELSRAKELANSIILLSDADLVDFICQSLVENKLGVSQILRSNDYIDIYYYELSNLVSPKLSISFKSRTVINDLNYPLEFKGQNRNGYINFLDSLGIKHDISSIDLLRKSL